MASAAGHFRARTIASIGPADVSAYKLWRLSASNPRQVQPVTVKHDLDNLSVFFRWAIDQGYARANPVRQVRKPSDADAIRQHVLTGAEEQAYLTASLRRFTLQGADHSVHEHGPFPDLHDVATLILRQGLSGPRLALTRDRLPVLRLDLDGLPAVGARGGQAG